MGTVTEEQFQQIERLVEADGRCFAPAIGLSAGWLAGLRVPKRLYASGVHTSLATRINGRRQGRRNARSTSRKRPMSSECSRTWMM